MIIFVANVLILFSIAYMLWKKETHLARPFFWPSFILKIAAGLAVGILYAEYYTEGDTYIYFNDGKILAGAARADFRSFLEFMWNSDPAAAFWSSLSTQQPRALFFAKLVGILNLITNDNYWLTASYLSLLSFVAAWYLVVAIEDYYKQAYNAAVFAFLFFPSVVLWTSGIVKESVAMSGVYFIVIIFLRFIHQRRIAVGHVTLLLVAVWVVWSLKYYYVAALLPVLFATVLTNMIIFKLKSKPGVVSVIFIWLVFYVIPVGVVVILHPVFHPAIFLQILVDNHDAFVSLSAPDDLIRFNNLTPDVMSIVGNSPNALFSGVFRPFIWEATNVFKLIAAAENLLILLLFIGAVIRWKRHIPVIVWPLLVYIIILAVFLSLSTPNFGTLSRYRVGYLPFFVLLISTNNYLTGFLERVLQRRKGLVVL